MELCILVPLSSDRYALKAQPRDGPSSRKQVEKQVRRTAPEMRGQSANNRDVLLEGKFRREAGEQEEDA